MKKQIIILGAGLSGLTIAYLLKNKGYSVCVLEARNRLGGRIYTKQSTNNTPVDMGATWFWKQNTVLIKLLKDLKIPIFSQNMNGFALFQPMASNPPQKVKLPPNQEVSYRIKGGSSTLIKQLSSFLEPEELFLNQIVYKVEAGTDKAIIHTKKRQFEADFIISTIPPKVAIHTIQYEPELPQNLINVVNNTHTWMEESIKFAVVYKNPFWKNEGLSGTVFSNTGPFSELYEHSNLEETAFALMGFLNSSLVNESAKNREKMVISKLKQFFGEEAASYMSYEELVWSKEKQTHFDTKQYITPHQNNGHPIYQDSFLGNKLVFAGTETSREFGGYMEGAVRRAHEIVKSF